MLSSCGARLLFGHDDKLNQQRQTSGASPNSSRLNTDGRRGYCITAADIAGTSNLSSDNLEFTFSSGGQSFLAARDDDDDPNCASTTTSGSGGGGGDRIDQSGEHQFALLSSGEFYRLGLNSRSTSFVREQEQLTRASESEQRGGRQFDDSLPQPPGVAPHVGQRVGSDGEQSVHTSARKLAAPLPPTPPQQAQQQQQHRKLQLHQSIHQKLQQIYGSRLQAIELQQQQQQNQEKRQRAAAADMAKQRSSVTTGHSADCVAHHHNLSAHNQRLEQTYDSLVSIDPLRPPAPPQPSLKSSEINHPGNEFYHPRAQQQRNQPEEDDDDEGDDGDDDDELEDVKLDAQFWAYAGKSEPARGTRTVSGKLHQRGLVSEAEHKRHLASIHYATSTAAALLNAAASATAAIATVPDVPGVGSHKAPISLHQAQHPPPPPERAYQQLYYHRHPPSRTSAVRDQQAQRQVPTKQQAAFLHWQRGKQQQHQQRPVLAQQPVYQIYAPVPLYNQQNRPSEQPRPAAVAHQFNVQHQQQQQRQRRQVPAGAPNTNTDAVLRAMAMIQNERIRRAQIQQQQRPPPLPAVGAQDARVLLSAVRLNEANRIYENALAGEMAHYQQRQRAHMLAACKPARQLTGAKKKMYADAAARQHYQMPPPRPPPPPIPLLPVLYNRLAPLARYASDDEGARALLSGSSSSGESSCHRLGPSAGPLNYASVPLIMRRNAGACGPASAQGELSLLGRLRRIDLTLFWWLLLIVCLVSLGFVVVLSRVMTAY